MSSSCKQPITQVRLTNIAVVRYRLGSNRFEIACFPNKVLDWRKRIETDITKVVQSDTIFTNVSRADLASAALLESNFGTTDKIAICKAILEKGELQVSSAERKKDTEMKLREIVQYITAVCINPETGLPLPPRMVENAIQQSGYSISPTKTAKIQAVDLIRIIKEKKIIPIERAMMRVRVNVHSQSTQNNNNNNSRDPAALARSARAAISSQWTKVEEESWTDGGGWSARLLIDPSVFRSISQSVTDIAGKYGIVEVMDQRVDDVIPMGTTNNASSEPTKGNVKDEMGVTSTRRRTAMSNPDEEEEEEEEEETKKPVTKKHGAENATRGKQAGGKGKSALTPAQKKKKGKGKWDSDEEETLESMLGLSLEADNDEAATGHVGKVGGKGKGGAVKGKFGDDDGDDVHGVGKPKGKVEKQVLRAQHQPQGPARGKGKKKLSKRERQFGDDDDDDDDSFMLPSAAKVNYNAIAKQHIKSGKVSVNASTAASGGNAVSNMTKRPEKHEVITEWQKNYNDEDKDTNDNVDHDEGEAEDDDREVGEKKQGRKGHGDDHDVDEEEEDFSGKGNDGDDDSNEGVGERQGLNKPSSQLSAVQRTAHTIVSKGIDDDMGVKWVVGNDDDDDEDDDD